MSLEVLFDPFFLFCVSCMVLPVWWEFPTLSQQDILDFYLHPSMLAAWGLLLATVFVTKKMGKTVKLSKGERMRARWYLLNGAIIHILLDGLVGAHKINPLMVRSYNRLDARYGFEVGNFDGALVHIVSAVELYLKGPVCLALYYAFHRGSPHRDVLEFFTCVTQAYGTIVYLGQEALSGMPHFDVDYELTFSLYHLLYFWFAVVIGCVLYLLFPTYLGYRSYMRIVEASARPVPKKK